MSYLMFFALTVGIEVALTALLARDVRLVAVIALVNLISHPIAFSAVGEGAHWLLVEAAVTIGEALIVMWAIPRNRARNFEMVVFANVVTARIGLLM